MKLTVEELRSFVREALDEDVEVKETTAEAYRLIRDEIESVFGREAVTDDSEPSDGTYYKFSVLAPTVEVVFEVAKSALWLTTGVEPEMMRGHHAWMQATAGGVVLSCEKSYDVVNVFVLTRAQYE